MVNPAGFPALPQAVPGPLRLPEIPLKRTNFQLDLFAPIDFSLGMELCGLYNGSLQKEIPIAIL